VAAPNRYVELSAEEWGRFGPADQTTFGEEQLAALAGPLAPRPEPAEVERVYLPLSRLLSLHIASSQQLAVAVDRFLERQPGPAPFLIGVAGSVAVGKSTTARLLQALLADWPTAPRVDLVTTDGFLHPNAELERRGLMDRKGFPESYDLRRLLAFLAQVQDRQPVVEAPVYSHVRYDIVPGQVQSVRRPDILIVEGLNVLSPAAAAEVVVSDSFQFTVYVDADEDDIERWYIERFLALCATVFQDSSSYFHRYATLGHAEAVATARSIWATINAVNLRENILPTRARAHIILEKGPDHRVRRVCLRTS